MPSCSQSSSTTDKAILVSSNLRTQSTASTSRSSMPSCTHGLSTTRRGHQPHRTLPPKGSPYSTSASSILSRKGMDTICNPDPASRFPINRSLLTISSSDSLRPSPTHCLSIATGSKSAPKSRRASRATVGLLCNFEERHVENLQCNGLVIKIRNPVESGPRLQSRIHPAPSVIQDFSATA